MKVLIVYASYDINDNLIHFCNNGYIANEMYDYYFVFNKSDIKLDILHKGNNVAVITRDNIGLDFGAWSHILLMENGEKEKLYQKYDYFILLNSTVTGPYLPQYCQDIEWPQIFIKKINKIDKLIGTSINPFSSVHGPSQKYAPHVQSMLLATDQIGIQIGIENKIFDVLSDQKKTDIIIHKEIGYSAKILSAGYNISCLLSAYNNYDFRQKPTDFILQNNNDHYVFNGYFGTNISPYEVVFFKNNRGVNTLLEQRYRLWHNNMTGIKHINKVLFDGDDVTSIIIDHLLQNKYLSTKSILKLKSPNGKLCFTFNTCSNVIEIPIKDGKFEKNYIFV